MIQHFEKLKRIRQSKLMMVVKSIPVKQWWESNAVRGRSNMIETGMWSFCFV